MWTYLQGWRFLRYTQKPMFRPLPPTITRTFVKTPGGEIELLVAEPKNKTTIPSHNPPIFFVHGGEGHASVWLEWMQHLSETYNARTYAYSLRTHGASYVVPYMKMVWRTYLDDLADDLVASIQEAQRREKQNLIVVGHSSGGGLCQYILSQNLVKARALVLVGAVPHFGNVQVYFNWFRRIDPWFSLRNMFHGFHPNSPMCTPRLVYNAFFGHEYPYEKVHEFFKWMSKYEAMWWPFGMAGRGWGITNRVWLNTTDIVKNLVHWKSGCDKVLIMIGTEDWIMLGTEARMLREYRESIQYLSSHKKIELVVEPECSPTPAVLDNYITEERAGGVRFVTVKNAGHHTQNDMQWEEAAEAVKRFAEQV